MHSIVRTNRSPFRGRPARYIFPKCVYEASEVLCAKQDVVVNDGPSVQQHAMRDTPQPLQQATNRFSL